jgi:hypothetical protein
LNIFLISIGVSSAPLKTLQKLKHRVLNDWQPSLAEFEFLSLTATFVAEVSRIPAIELGQIR